MIYSIIVHCSPSSRSTFASAFKFASALLQSEHQLHRVFFYGEAVHIANYNTVQPQDEPDLFSQWKLLIEQHRLDAVICIAAALKRGIIDAAEAERYDLRAVTGQPYVLSGLGQLVEACASSDRVITFA